MKYLSNAFSLGMIESGSVPVITEGISPAEFIGGGNRQGRFESLAVKSIVGHADTAAILSGILGVTVLFNRESVKLVPGDVLYVAQYDGPRLPEGCTELPEGASFRWFRVSVISSEQDEEITRQRRRYLDMRDAWFSGLSESLARLAAEFWPLEEIE